jgi:hypothetical protein
MKRMLVVLTLLLVLTFAATPAFADGPNGGDYLCTGGSAVIRSEDTVDSVVLFGCGARIESGAHVKQDVVSFGGNVVVEKGARIDHDMVVFGGNVTVGGEVQHDVTLFGGNVLLESSAVVNHDVIAVGGNVDQREGSVVRGRVTRGTSGRVPPIPVVPPVPPVPSVNGGNVVGGVVGGVVGMVFSFLRSLVVALALATLGVLTVVFLPTQTKQVADVAEKSALPSLGVGCLTLIVFVPLLLLMVILIITIPVAILMPLALAIVALFGWIAIGRLLGEKVIAAVKARESLQTPIIAVVVGIFLLALVTWLPVAGWLISLFVGTLAIGAVILSRFGTRSYPYVPVPVVSGPSAPVAPSTSIAPVIPSSSAIVEPPASASPPAATNDAKPDSGDPSI